MSKFLGWFAWLGFGKSARLVQRREEPNARARKAALTWGFTAALLVAYDLVTGIFPIGPLGAAVMLLLAIPLGAVPGFVVERCAFALNASQGWRLALTLFNSAIVFTYLSIGLSVPAAVLGGMGLVTMLGQVLVCIAATAPILVGTWLYLRSMVAPRSQHLALAAALLTTGLVPAVADHFISIEEYAVVHTVLRWSAVAGIGSGLFLFLPETHGVRRGSLFGVIPAFVTGFILFPHARPEFGPGMHSRPFGRLVLESARTLVDFDADGYAQWLDYDDCAPFDANINPGRREIAGNGIDENCRLGDAPVAPPIFSLPATRTAVPADAPSILIVTTDALRADHVSGYGYPQPTTPHLDAWAKQATLFTSAYTPGSRTGSTLPALHYGVWAERLTWTPLFETKRGMVTESDLKHRELFRRVLGFALEQPRPSLPRILRERGYQTAAIVDDGKSPFLDLQPGFLSDYASYSQMKMEKGVAYGDEATTAKAREVLRSLAGRRFFLWVHYFGTHTPTTRTKGLPDFGFDQVGGYDHEIRVWDEALAKLLLDADELAKTQPMVVVVSSDHGEVFKPLGRGHGVSAEEANFHVPLVVRASGMPSGKSDALVSSLDLVPMLLNLTGGTQGLELDGIDLLDVAKRPEQTRNRVLFSEVSGFRKDQSVQFYLSLGLGFGRKVVFDQVRNQVTVWKLGDFSDELVPHDVASERVLQALLRHLETTPGMLLTPSK